MKAEAPVILENGAPWSVVTFGTFTTVLGKPFAEQPTTRNHNCDPPGSPSCTEPVIPMANQCINTCNAFCSGLLQCDWESIEVDQNGNCTAFSCKWIWE